MLAQLLGLAESELSAGRKSYDLRRLRLHGIFERIPQTQRYRLTAFGLQTALFHSRVYQRLLRPGLSQLCDLQATAARPLSQAFLSFQRALDAFTREKNAA